MLPPLMLIPGLGGVSSHPITDQEALLVQNMDLLRDGTYRPRGPFKDLGYGSFGNSISGIWLWPWSEGDGYVFLTENGDLQTYAIADDDQNTVDTGWPTGADRPVSAVWGMNSAGQQVWLAPKRSYTATPGAGDLQGVLGDGNLINSMTSGLYTDAYWLSNHHNLILALRDGHQLAFSAPGNAQDWSASDTFPLLPEIGFAQSIHPMGGQSVVLGSHGAQLIEGQTDQSIAQAPLFRYPGGGGRSLPEDADGDFVHQGGLLTVQVGETLIWDAGGLGRLLTYSGGGNIERIDAPMRGFWEAFDTDVASERYARDLRAFYDPTRHAYCVSFDNMASRNSSVAVTYLYDLERRVWSGSWDVCVRCAAYHQKRGVHRPILIGAITSAPTRMVGLQDWNHISGNDFIDQGKSANFTCKLRSNPSYRDAVGSYKQTHKVFVDADGTWSATVYYRNGPSDAWTSLAGAASVAAPGWIYFASHMYQERYFEFSAQANKDLRFRRAVVHERKTGRFA